MRAYFSRAIADAHVIEVRHFDGVQVTSGLFNNVDALCSTLDALGGRGNSYTTLNVPRKVQVTNAMASKALCDDDIETIVRLPFDFDPVRPKAMPSNAEELEAAARQRNHLVRVHHALGWPAPAMAISGNGSHAIYRCRLPANSESREILLALYRGLQVEFSTPQVIFDPSVRNPSRIWRAYGTVNRKGQATSERPHRTAVVSLPAPWEGVSRGQIEALASRYARVATRISGSGVPGSAPIARTFSHGHGDYSTLNVAEWFAAHGLYRRPLGSGKHSVTCPWLGEHTSAEAHPLMTDTVIWDPQDRRWPSFHCSHAHCDGRSIIDVMNLWRDADRHCTRPWRTPA